MPTPSLFNNKIEQDEKKNTQRGEKKNRQPENCSTINIHTRHKTMDQPRTADTRRLNRETKVGDTGGATETMIS